MDDVIYFPHNMDFRGRTYPIPPHLNHMGSDISRGLLTFAEGKPLGRDGINWLKVHIANLLGVDKISFEERIAYVDNHMQQIQGRTPSSLFQNLCRTRWTEPGGG